DRIDVLAPGYDEVGPARMHEEATVIVDLTEIARVEPTLRIDGTIDRAGSIITEHEHRAADEDPAFADRELRPPECTTRPELDAPAYTCSRFASRRRSGVAGRLRRHLRACFGETVRGEDTYVAPRALLDEHRRRAGATEQDRTRECENVSVIDVEQCSQHRRYEGHERRTFADDCVEHRVRIEPWDDEDRAARGEAAGHDREPADM